MKFVKKGGKLVPVDSHETKVKPAVKTKVKPEVKEKPTTDKKVK